MNEQNLTMGYLLIYIKHEIQRIAALPDAQNNKDLNALMSALDVIWDAAAHNIREAEDGRSRVLGIADELSANIGDISHGSEFKSTWPSDEEIEWAALHDRERGLKYPFDTGSSRMTGDSI
ncbi:MAG: hypothetical protein F9K46_19375 [Anaerolineae bacterium]|nr:MAG: hypothetical protein F9K46_19375 [Anaerolineae bacterium]